jgi:hypothetical protein
VLTFVGLGLAIGIGFGLYAVFRWMIPFMDTVLFPWMAHLEQTVGRATGLVVFLIVVLAIQGALIPLWVRYVRAVRARCDRRNSTDRAPRRRISLR